MADLTRAELIERLEALQGPDRDVDGQLSSALRVGNNLPDWAANWQGEWRPTIHGSVVLMQDDGNPGPHFSSPAYTGSLDAAVALVEKVLPDAEVLAISRTKSGGWGAGVNGHVAVGSANGAIAILIALLRSLEAKEGER